MKKDVATTPDGKIVETTEYEDGRKGVVINVNSLEIDETDEESIQAKKIIEERVLPQLQAREVYVTVIHKPSNNHVDAKVKLQDVRRFAEQCISTYSATVDASVKNEDFVLVTFDGDNVEVSSL